MKERGAWFFLKKGKWIPTIFVILITLLFLLVLSGKVMAIDSSAYVNVFTYSTALHEDTNTAWYTFVKTHTDWQVTGKDWYIPHFKEGVDSADQLGIGQYENWNHLLLSGEDYSSILSCMTGLGEPLESLFVHFKWNTVQSWDAITYMFPGWDASNDGNSDGVNDYSGDWSRTHTDIAHIGINSAASGDDTIYVYNCRAGMWEDEGDTCLTDGLRNWTNDLYNGGTFVIGWNYSQNDSACTTTVVDTYNDSVLLVDSIPDRVTYIFFYVSHVDMPNPYANAQADSQSRVRTYTDYQFIANYRNANFRACHSKYLCDELRDRKTTLGYDGRLGIFYDNAWVDCKPSIMGRASWNRPQYPRQGATNFETVEGWWEDAHEVRQANYALLPEVFDSLDALPFPTYCGANMGNYFTGEYDSLMWQFKSQGSVLGASFFERIFGNDAYNGGRFIGMIDQVGEMRAEGDMFILINYDSYQESNDTARGQMFALCSFLQYQYDSVYIYYGYFNNWANAVKDWDAGAGVDCKWWIPLMKFNLGDTVTATFSWTQDSQWKGWRRDFDSAVVITRPRPDQISNCETEVTVDFNDTFFYEIDRFGDRLSEDSADQFTIMNCEGIFLEKAWGLADSLQQTITKSDTGLTSYSVFDDIHTDYTEEVDSATFWHGTNGDWDSLTRTDVFTGSDTGTFEATGLSENTKYYFRCIAWDDDPPVSDTTLLDSIWTLSSDSIYQVVTHITTTANSFTKRDSIISTYSETADSGNIRVSTTNSIATSIWKATFTGANAGNLQASGLNSSTKYYFWCLGWDSGHSDTTIVDSVTTSSATGEAGSFTCDYTLIEDAYMASGDPTFNYGGATELRIGGTAYKYTLLKCIAIGDSLSGDANVDSAYFEIYLSSLWSIDPTEFLSVTYHNLKKAWGEGVNIGSAADSLEVNWLSAKASVDDWASGGASDTLYDRYFTKESDGVHVDTLYITDTTTLGYYKIWLNPSTVEGWRDGDNHGIVLRLSTEGAGSNHQVIFSSAEAGSNEPGFVCFYSSAQSPRKFAIFKK